MKKGLLASLFYLSIKLCIGQSYDSVLNHNVNLWSHFDGKIGEELAGISLFPFENGEVKGDYYLKKDETKIWVSGKMDKDSLNLIAFTPDKKLYRYFNGRMLKESGTIYAGNWYDSTLTVSIPFKFQLSWICGGTIERRYHIGIYSARFFGTDDEIENFAKLVKKAIASEDKQWIADHIEYPFYTRNLNGNPITFKTKNDLIVSYHKFIPVEWKELVKSYEAIDLFCDSHGVSFFDSKLLIGNTHNSTETDYTICIISIN